MLGRGGGELILGNSQKGMPLSMGKVEGRSQAGKLFSSEAMRRRDRSAKAETENQRQKGSEFSIAVYNKQGGKGE